MGWLIVGACIVVVAIVIGSFAGSEESEKIAGESENVDEIDISFKDIESLFYKGKNYEAVLDITVACDFKNNVKLSEFLANRGESHKQSDLYSILTSEYFKLQYYIFDVTEITTDGEPDIILSYKMDDEEHKRSDNGYYDSTLDDDDDDLDDEYLTSDDLESIILDLSEYDEFDDRIELPIRGINFRGLTDENIGAFQGFLMSNLNNEYDEYAIGVYGADGTHFGFIEKGQKYLHQKIEENGGSISGIIEIDKNINESDSYFFGNITVNKEYLL